MDENTPIGPQAEETNFLVWSAARRIGTPQVYNLAGDAAVNVADFGHGLFSFGLGLQLLLQPCPSARPGVASARRLRTRNAEGPRSCGDAWGCGEPCLDALRTRGAAAPEKTAAGRPPPKKASGMEARQGGDALAAPCTTAQRRRRTPARSPSNYSRTYAIHLCIHWLHCGHGDERCGTPN
jgi:hypothetical protein